MTKFRKIVYITISVIGLLLAICSIASVFRNTDSRYLKMLDFPRIEFFVTSMICLIILLVVSIKRKWYDYLLAVLLISGLVINGAYLVHYTPLVPKLVPSANIETKADQTLSLLITNVKMSNRNSKDLLQLIKQKQPDLILAMEINAWWDKQLNILEKQYPYSQHTINEVTYGMVLYSKFPINDMEVNYLQNKKVPSFNSVIVLPGDKKVALHCMHPVPPTLFEDLPDNEGQQELALQKLGKKILSRQYPTIVAGDLNDVVWSHVDELTGTENILFDVRVGRGFYNSYSAENVLISWPLDHIFVTKEFQLKSLERLSKIGSDHYPIYVELVL